MPTPIRRLLRAAAPLVAVPVLVASLAACGGDSDSSPAASSSSTSSATTPSAGSTGSATALSGTSVDSADFTALLQRSLDKATTAKIALDLVSASGTLKGRGQIDYTGKSPALDMKLDAPSMGSAELRVIGQTLYLSLPGSDDSGTFFKTDLDSGAAAQLGGLSGFDPAALLTALSQSITAVTLVGSEDLDGDQVDHYTFTADGSDLPGAGASGAAGEVTVSAWFDDQDRLRKTETALGAATKVTVTLSDWGSKVDIEAPPASKVKTMPSGG